jgi:DNA mismatch endonuclease (patch repair protein)
LRVASQRQKVVQRGTSEKLTGQKVPSWASSPGVRRSMQSNRPRDTVLELDLRSALHRIGVRFRKHVRPVPGVRCEADLVFPRRRIAVFLDGCFWHGCPIHATHPATHGDWWAAKLAGNIERDRRNTELLLAEGWTVLRLWEHQPLEEMVAVVVAAAAPDERIRNSKQL